MISLRTAYEKAYPELPEGVFPVPDDIEPIARLASAGEMQTSLDRPSPRPRGLLLITVKEDTWSFAALTEKATAVIGKDGRFKRERLGEGLSSKVYEATLLELSPNDTTYRITQIAISKIRKHYFLESSFRLLETIPPSPHLLARPMHFYQSQEKAKYVYMAMPLLPGKRDLHDLISDDPDNHPKNFKLVIEACHHASLGLKLLHKCDIVHADIKPENLTPYGLFDYGSLHKEGPDQLYGAGVDLSPPELIFYLISDSLGVCWADPMKSLIRETCQRFFKWYGREKVLEARPKLLPKKNYRDKYGRVLYPYTKAGDVYLLGEVITGYFFDQHPSAWKKESPRMDALQAFVTRMLALYPDERPSMEECAAFFGSFVADISSPASDAAPQGCPQLESPETE